MEADSTTGSANRFNAKVLLDNYVTLKNYIAKGKFNVTVLHHGTVIEQIERKKAIFIGCLGCGAEITTTTIRCPKNDPGPECARSGAWHFMNPNEQTSIYPFLGRGKHPLCFDLLDY